MQIPEQLLYFEALLKGSAGLLLFALPMLTVRALGLPVAANGFWPRMLGIALIGMAGASAIEALLKGKNGLGLAGSLFINVVAILLLLALIIMGRSAPTRRGRIVIWLTILILTAMSLVEVAYAA